MKISESPIAVIFDMDGVIIDSNPAIIKAWKNFFIKNGIKLSDDQLRYYVFGRTSTDTLKTVFTKQLDEKMILEYSKALNEEVAILYKTESKLVEGIADFAKSLVDHKIAIGIATSAPGENVDLVLSIAGLTNYFKVVINASHVHFPKPNPEIYLKTANRLGVEPSRCIVFEDSFSGIAAANAAGMIVIGLTTTHPANELISETTEVISDFTDIDVSHIINLIGQRVANNRKYGSSPQA